MGQRTTAMIREFQRQVGIEPATGHDAELLERMKREAAQLIEILVLEESSIRDGDGHWHGSNPLDCLIRDLRELTDKYFASEKREEPEDGAEQERLIAWHEKGSENDKDFPFSPKE